MGCFAAAEWKREQIPEHKFDYVDVEDFVDHGVWRKVSYLFVFLGCLKSILVYMADISIIVLLIVSGAFDVLIASPENLKDTCAKNPFLTSVCAKDSHKILDIQPWVSITIYCVSILLSFLLLGLESIKARKIIQSRDISYAFTSVIAHKYYALRSYPHFCLFSLIQNSRKAVDVLAFYVFFKFKGKIRVKYGENNIKVGSVFYLLKEHVNSSIFSF